MTLRSALQKTSRERSLARPEPPLLKGPLIFAPMEGKPHGRPTVLRGGGANVTRYKDTECPVIPPKIPLVRGGDDVVEECAAPTRAEKHHGF